MQVRESTIAVIWRVTLVFALMMQAVLLLFTAPLGGRSIRRVMLRTHAFPPSQAAAFDKLLHPPGDAAFKALAAHIDATVPPNTPIVLFTGDQVGINMIAEITYLLYPRPLTQAKMSSTSQDEDAFPCRIVVRTESDVAFFCDHQSWTYAEPLP